MSDINPYAAPNTRSKVVDPDSWLWRDGTTLVMHKEAILPNRCVKSGATVSERGILREYTWHPPAIAILILAGILPYVLVSLIVSKRAKIVVPLSKTERKRRAIGIAIGWLIGLSGLGVVVLILVAIGNTQLSIRAAIAGLFLGASMIVFGMMFGQAKAAILKPTKISKKHVWLKGVHPSILDGLPEVSPRTFS